MSETETQIFRQVYRFFNAHPTPPPSTDADATMEWWQAAGKDLAVVCSRWNNHPLTEKLLTAVYEYLEMKARG